MTISKAPKFLFTFIIILLSFNYCESDSREHESIKLAENRQICDDSSGSEARKAALSDIQYSRQNIITNVVEKASPAIVGINVTELVQVAYRDPFDAFMSDPYFQRFFGNRDRAKRYREYQVQGLGSGFIISKDGYIITNHHVAGNASKVIVTTTDGKKHEAKIIGADKTSDVALLKIEGDNFPYLRMCQSDEAIIGEWVIAFGNPFGLFNLNTKPTVTVGVVSNDGINFVQDGRIYKNMLQTDAAISSGNSGGPLLNALGEVIGVNTVIYSTAQNKQGAGSIGIGFSIPIQRVQRIVKILKEKGAVDRNYQLGLEVREMDEKLARYLGMDLMEGIVVIAIERQSITDEAGIEPGDIILEVNGKKTISNDDFYLNAFDGIVGESLNIKLQRGDKQLTKTIQLTSNK